MTTLLTAQGSTALLLRGTEGEPFANPRRRPDLMGFRNGVAELLFAADEGGTPPISGWPETADFDENVKLIQQLLVDRKRVPHPILDQVNALKALSE